jgi:putative flippase GtrA
VPIFLKKHTKKLAQYSSTGVPAFLIDLGLLYLLTDLLRVQYLISAGIAFIIATSVNYLLARRIAFAETIRSIGKGYAYFLTVAFLGSATVLILMYILVGQMGLPILLSRLAIAAVVGFISYLMHYYLTFRVHVPHQSQIL